PNPFPKYLSHELLRFFLLITVVLFCGSISLCLGIRIYITFFLSRRIPSLSFRAVICLYAFSLFRSGSFCLIGILSLRFFRLLLPGFCLSLRLGGILISSLVFRLNGSCCIPFSLGFRRGRTPSAPSCGFFGRLGLLEHQLVEVH